MMWTSYWRWNRAIWIALLLGVLIIPSASATHLVQARGAHDTCNVSDWYDYPQDTITTSSGSAVVQVEVHYRVNSDCSWKAYYANSTSLTGNGPNPPVPYTLGNTLYQGFSGSPQQFDNDGTHCSRPPATYNFNQYSATTATIGMFDDYHLNGCSGPVYDYLYYFSHQP